MNESSRATTDASTEVEEDERRSQNRVSPGIEVPQTIPNPSNALTSQHSVITEFDCMRYFLCASGHCVYFV